MAGAGEAGGQVMIHWTQCGPSVQPLADHGGQRSADEDEDADEEDDELLVPAPPRERLSYTRYQLELLNGIFGSVRYPNSVQKQLIAKRVGISREQVKIWFQNRRRKDVVMSKTSTSTDSTHSPQDDASPADSSTPSLSPHASGSLPNGDPATDSKAGIDSNNSSCADSQRDSHKPRMVPDAVINGCISELRRFSDEKLKERKEKRKAKGKRRHHASSAAVAAGGSSSIAQSALQAGGSSNALKAGQANSRLFQAYDMVAPPNKVTPTAAFLDTSANRFHHSHNSSAFTSPRDHLVPAASMPRLAWDGGLDTTGAGGGGLGGLGGLGVGLMPGSQTQTAGVGMAAPQDTLPVLADLLTFRQHVDTATATHDSREASLPPSPPCLPPPPYLPRPLS